MNTRRATCISRAVIEQPAVSLGFLGQHLAPAAGVIALYLAFAPTAAALIRAPFLTLPLNAHHR